MDSWLVRPQHLYKQRPTSHKVPGTARNDSILPVNLIQCILEEEEILRNAEVILLRFSFQSRYIIVYQTRWTCLRSYIQSYITYLNRTVGISKRLWGSPRELLWALPAPRYRDGTRTINRVMDPLKAYRKTDRLTFIDFPIHPIAIK